MPKIYRVMKKDGDKPLLGETASALGVRVPRDIVPGADNVVSPDSNGMSVTPSIAALIRMPARMVPVRLKPFVPGAAGNDDLFAWSMGQGKWAENGEPLAPGLQLRPDPTDDQHGFVEPNVAMLLDEYRAAIAATRNLWQVDEA